MNSQLATTIIFIIYIPIFWLLFGKDAILWVIGGYPLTVLVSFIVIYISDLLADLKAFKYEKIS